MSNIARQNNIKTNTKNISNSKYTRRYTARHPLAKLAISQIEKRGLRPQDIVKAMGYPQKHILSACDRLRYVLSSDILGLDDTGVDSKEVSRTDADEYFTAHEFLKSLLLVLEMQYELFQDDIAQIEYDLAHYLYPLPRYHLRADIDFTFTAGANWMSRGGAAQLANAYLPESIAKMSGIERESIVQQSIDEHYKKYDGHLPYDGVIKGYWLITKLRNEVIERVAYGLPKPSSL